jgi:hypothetical protein
MSLASSVDPPHFQACPVANAVFAAFSEFSETSSAAMGRCFVAEIRLRVNLSTAFDPISKIRFNLVFSQDIQVITVTNLNLNSV